MAATPRGNRPDNGNGDTSVNISANWSDTERASTLEVTSLGDFATLTPDGKRAVSAFNNVVAFLEQHESDPVNQGEPYHQRFLDLCLETPAEPESNHESSSSDAEPESPSASFSSESSTARPHPTTSRGRYRLSLDALPEGPNAAWRIGKGSARAPDNSRGVDLLLVPPGQHKGSGVANVHALISIQSLSGAFMIRSTSNRPIIYLSAAEDGSDLVLRRGEQAVLYKTVNRLRIAELDYLLSFSVEQEDHFQLLRNQFITTVLDQRTAPHPKLDVIPQPYHQKTGGYIMHRGISAGGFGMVRSAVESATGCPVAVKRLSYRNQTESNVIANEARVAGRFTSQDPESGVVPLLSTWCEHSSRLPCGQSPEDVFLAMPLALTDFGHAEWSSISLPTRLTLFHHTLVGLERIHADGIMHRDISVKNLLIRSLDPPVAAICDFGKATEKTFSTNTAIGPIPTVAPCVWASTLRRPYGRPADVWSLGYAWLSTYGHLDRFKSAQGNEKTDQNRNWLIERELAERVRSGAVPRELGILIKDMMAFDALDRCTAQQALKYPIWELLAVPDTSSLGSEDLTPNAKRPRLLTPDPEDLPGENGATQSTIPNTQQ